MNSKITAFVLSAATAFSFAPKPAEASDKGLALIGGFIGGVLVASAIHDSHRDACPPERTPVIVAGGPRCVEPSGYWKEVRVKVWVPACWIEERGRYGRVARRHVSGHYEYRTDRVWIASSSHGHREREVCYGYGR
jgi:hypothetical protein